ncbi:hypothetical protein NDN08_007375 [Rhodosorus marinus]|uniref:CEMIP beta-helix domain-containing protein n=1 Tax=Rhodosorus marinus TaxID=101924 RepID=A0AAV8UJA8_9RHOD|nr:hypothetical protein NDN08_007375 [Rhodosorus marinus]
MFWKLVIFCLGLFGVISITSAQVQYGHQSCNKDLLKDDWKPKRYERFSEILAKTPHGKPVKIPCGVAVIVDTKDIPKVNGIEVLGLLYVPPNVGKLVVRTQYVLVTGYLRVGDERGMRKGSRVDFVLDNFDYKLKDVIVNSEELEIVGGKNEVVGSDGRLGRLSFAVIGGQIEIHGLARKDTRSVHNLLHRRAEKGDEEITVEEPCEWPIGSRILIATTSYRKRETEERVIKGTSTNSKGMAVLKLNRPLKYKHLATEDSYEDVKGYKVEMPAEVVLLTRPVRISRRKTSKQSSKFGPHLMVANTQLKQVIHGVEFVEMGQLGTLGRYPIHFHLCGKTDWSEVYGCSILRSNQRGIVIHGTDKVKIFDNVLYDGAGHQIMMEDGIEEQGKYYRNVVVNCDAIRRRDLLPDSSDDQVSGIWISNPRNEFKGNRVVGSEVAGIFTELRAVTGPSKELPRAKNFDPRFELLDLFVDNVVHTNGEFGLWFNGWTPPKRVSVGRINSYRNLVHGVLMELSSSLELHDSVLVDNGGGIDLDRMHNSRVSDSLIVGKSKMPGANCPKAHSVEFKNRMFERESRSAYLANVTFDGFKDCKSTGVVGVQGDDPAVQFNGWSTSTGLRNCHFLDIGPDQGFGLRNAEKSDFQWSEFVAIPARDTTWGKKTIPNGFAIADTPFMVPDPKRKKCVAIREFGKFCSGVCFRTVNVQLTVDSIFDLSYQLEVIKVDGKLRSEVVVSPFKSILAPTKLQYFFTVETAVKYAVKLRKQDNRPFPTRMFVDVGDQDLRCTRGDILLDFEMDGFSLGRARKEKQPAKRYWTGCRKKHTPSTSVYYQDKCKGGKMFRRVTIPHKALPYNRQQVLASSGLEFNINEGSPKCKTDKTCD